MTHLSSSTSWHGLLQNNPFLGLLPHLRYLQIKDETWHLRHMVAIITSTVPLPCPHPKSYLLGLTKLLSHLPNPVELCIVQWMEAEARWGEASAIPVPFCHLQIAKYLGPLQLSGIVPVSPKARTTQTMTKIHFKP